LTDRAEELEEGTLESRIELLQRHVEMLRTIRDNQPIGIIKLSEMFNYPRHKVRYSLRILEEEGLILPTPDGAHVTDKVGEYLDRVKKSLDETLSMIDELRRSL
jgi:predicted transcriptional regulator